MLLFQDNAPTSVAETTNCGIELLSHPLTHSVPSDYFLFYDEVIFAVEEF